MDVDIHFKYQEEDGDSEEKYFFEAKDEQEALAREAFRSAILCNDASTFANMINNGFTTSNMDHPEDFLGHVCRLGSVGCASALLKGETRLTVDIHSPLNFALHQAAIGGFPDVTELLLVNNAKTGVRREAHECFSLPIHLALHAYANDECKLWTPKTSVNQLLFSLCLPDEQETLETIGLLAWTTKYIEEEFLRYVKAGDVVEVAALLIVAWKKLCDPAITARSLVTQNEVLVSRDRKRAMLQLFEIFETAGVDLEEYVKRPKTFASKRRAITEVKYLLQRKGIKVKCEETDLSFFPDRRNRFIYPPNEPPNEEDIYDDKVPRLPRDFFMEHYGKSGHRWEVNSWVPKINLCLMKKDSHQILLDINNLQISMIKIKVHFQISVMDSRHQNYSQIRMRFLHMCGKSRGVEIYTLL